jgi:hypothetical protein
MSPEFGKNVNKFLDGENEPVPPRTFDEAVAELVEIIKDEIQDDPKIPKGCRTFSALHDYCDANCLGGMDEFPDMDTDEKAQEAYWNEVQRFLDAVQDAVDTWLRNGRPTTSA